jgi:aspartate/methionine/tyrosine aminotransferase
MQFPERFSNLSDYAFPRLRALLEPHEAGGEAIHMLIGEPQHAPPQFALDLVTEHAGLFAKYPANDGIPELRSAIADWIARRYGVPMDPDVNIMPVNGTREGLFNAAIALSPEEKGGKKPAILMPNPFYQCYAVAAVSVGAEPVYVPADASNAFLPDFTSLPAEVLDRTTLAYMCSPSNPQGGVADRAYWTALIELAEKHDFRIIADECYSEIYRGNAPDGALEAADAADADPERVLVFHSLSKRSNLPGFRSGFIAGGGQAIAAMKKLRSYAGAPIPLPIQHASAAAWADEQHVTANRALYAAKYEAADALFGDMDGYFSPTAGFFLWLDVGDSEKAAVRFWKNAGVRVLPGKYLSREDDGTDPGAAYVRVALVAEYDEMRRGLEAIRANM